MEKDNTNNKSKVTSSSQQDNNLVRDRYKTNIENTYNATQESQIATSICDVMKDDTSEVIQKLESTIPTFAQNYSDLYNAYLHMLDDIHGTCCISEKEFVEKMNLDPKVIEELRKYSDVIKDASLSNIEISTTLYDAYVKMRISMIKSFDSYAHIWMESYGKMLSEFNKNADKWNKTN